MSMLGCRCRRWAQNRRWHRALLVRCCEGYSHANMRYARQGLQERQWGWRMGAGWGIVDGGGCEQRVVATCDIVFVTSPNWDVFNCVAHPLILDTVSRMRLIPFWGVCRCTYILELEGGRLRSVICLFTLTDSYYKLSTHHRQLLSLSASKTSGASYRVSL